MADDRLPVQHGHWGEVAVGAVPIFEVTAIEYSIEIERVEVPQAGARWQEFHEGLITAQGELRIHDVYDDFEGSFLPYLILTPTQLRNYRDGGGNARPTTTIKVAKDDPTGAGRSYETLTGVSFWQYTGGFDITNLIGRTWPFTFSGIVKPIDGYILRNGNPFLYA
jgi:hypothetical protein